MHELISQIRACRICEPHLPLGAKPIVQLGGKAKILLVGQAPGAITHHKGVPFDDPSGERLRGWLGVDRARFYDPDCFAIAPMGFCFPGTGRSGDLPPRPECAATWRKSLMAALEGIELTLILGTYAQKWHLGDQAKATVSETVAAWQDFWPEIIALPHPSPRNNRWLKENPWFEADVVPRLRERVRELI